MFQRREPDTGIVLAHHAINQEQLMNQDEALARIEALEIRIAHQDRAIEDLSTTARDQWERIDRLTRQIELMADRIQRAEDSAPPDRPDPPPPHY
ncbi:MAG: SlyX family protein [Xanthobacteraceae bacterium]